MHRLVAASGLAALACACARPAPSAPSWDELRNATYGGVLAAPITLSQGRWLGEPFEAGGASRPRLELLDGLRLEGDLDGDGVPEAVALVAASEGGSGSFVHLAVVTRRGRSVESVATARIGDRVQVRSGAIENGRIQLDLLEPGQQDAACCPTEKARRAWRLEGETLNEVESQTMGPISVLDLTGHEWVLRAFDEDLAPPSPEITLTLEAERISGHAGCNRYFAARGPAGERPTDLRFGPIGATRMACPEPAMSLERRYLDALGAVVGFGFAPGRLRLRWARDDARGELVFEAR